MTDPRSFGRLEASVENLGENVKALALAVTELSKRLEAIEDRYKLGRGAIVGGALMAILAMYGASGLVDKLIGMVAK